MRLTGDWHETDRRLIPEETHDLACRTPCAYPYIFAIMLILQPKPQKAASVMRVFFVGLGFVDLSTGVLYMTICTHDTLYMINLYT